MGQPQRPGKQNGSKLLGEELRNRRGHRSYAEMSRLSKLPPLAEKVESVSASYLHKVEQGRRIPSLEKLRTIGMLYGMTLEHMIRLIESERLAEVEPEGDDWSELMEAAREAISLGEYRDAFAAAKKAGEVAASTRQRVAAIGTRANALWKLGYPREASIEIQELLGIPGVTVEQKVAAFYHLACIQRSLWNPTLAEAYARIGLDLVSKDSTQWPYLLRVLGNALSDRAEQEEDSRAALCREAVRIYERAEEGFKASDEQDQIATTRCNLGVVYRIEGNRLLAFQRLQEALDLSRQSRNQWAVAFTLKEMGKTFLEADDWKQARRFLVDAEASAAGSGYPDLQFQSLFYLIRGRRGSQEPFSALLRRACSLLPYLEDKFPEREQFEELLPKLRREQEGA